MLELDTDDVHYDVEEGIGWITFNRPERLNAFSLELLTGTWQALEDANHNPEVRVVVLTGAGDRAFCAGGDVKRMRDHLQEGATAYPLTNHQAVIRLASSLNNFPKPTIAALNGVAAGAGFELALQTDFRIAADHAYLKPAALHIGMVPGDGSVFFLPRLVGMTKAAEILFTERPIRSAEALDLGLFNQVVPGAELRDATTAFAAELVAKAPIALQLTKRALKLGVNADLGTVMEYLAIAVQKTRVTEDHKEGIKAFHEKRAPIFEGR